MPAQTAITVMAALCHWWENITLCRQRTCKSHPAGELSRKLPGSVWAGKTGFVREERVCLSPSLTFQQNKNCFNPLATADGTAKMKYFIRNTLSILRMESLILL